MSDFISNSNADIGAALDRAFASVGDPVRDDNGASILPPNPQDVDWQQQGEKQAALEKAAKKAVGKDKAAAKDEKSEGDEEAKDGKRLGKMEIQGRKKVAQEEGVESAVDKAMDRSAKEQERRSEARKLQAKGQAPKELDSRSFSETREHRRAIREIYPEGKISELLAFAEKAEAELRKDTSMAGVEKLAKAFAKLSPHVAGKTQAKEADDGVSRAVSRGFEDVDDYNDLKPFIDRYGERLPHILQQAAKWLPEFRQDPFGAAARYAATLGALDQPQQAAVQRAPPAERMAPPATPQEDYERVTLGVQKAIEQNVLPALANDEVAEQVAFVLERMTRTADRFADLQKAYSIVVGQAAPADPVKDDKGRKSISGGPNMSSGRRASKGSGSLDDALNRAFGGI